MQFAFHKSARGAAYSRYESKFIGQAAGRSAPPRTAPHPPRRRGRVVQSSQPSRATRETRVTIPLPLLSAPFRICAMFAASD
ncbi:jg26053 [Pararge aegeria aegeria]|uniref:Jg26053 protein n=1 Tax=Pararge aegeria aegeria TaxID=348720 RepID=A0A8S4QVP8_9NEOP|nr:jg26053 [Pararge aegeria aegeria]